MDLSQIGLKNKAAAFKEAKAVATQHLGAKVVTADECALQGMFSYIIEITMKDSARCVVKLRAETVLEENSQQAHHLGDIVPVPIRVVRDSSPVPFVHIMPRIRGLTCYTATARTPRPAEHHVKFAGQIGDMIGRWCSNKNMTECDTIDNLLCRVFNCT